MPLTKKPDPTKSQGASLLAAAREALAHAQTCRWPDCSCKKEANGSVLCAASGCVLHFREPDHSPS